jgi:hypothetical protein
MLLSYAFGICPPRSSLRPGSGLPCGRPPPRLLPKEPPCRSTPPSSLFRSEHRHPEISMSPLQPRREDRPASGRSREPPQAHSAIGSLRRMPTHAHAADSYARSLPPGHTPTGQGCLPRLVPCRGSASPVSCWFVHGYPPFRGFSPLAPHDPLGSCCPPCRFLAEHPPERVLDAIRREGPAEASPLARNHLAVSRLRGFEPPAHLAPCGVRPRCERMRSPPSALFTPSTGRSSPGCSSPSRMTSRPRPTLLQGSSHGLQSCTRALGPPRGELRAQMYVRSSEFQRTGRTDPILIARQAELP